MPHVKRNLLNQGMMAIRRCQGKAGLLHDSRSDAYGAALSLMRTAIGRLSLIGLCGSLLLAPLKLQAQQPIEFKAEPHNYFQRTSRDPFARFQEQMTKGTTKLDVSSDLALLRSLLTGLNVPLSSQMLVFSATSLQDDKIHPTNPRALYFNEDTYVGFVPGGRMEVIGIDPEMGAVFYIFDRLNPGAAPVAQRSDKCMNCHAGNATKRVPGLIAESVMPAANGSSLESYRHEESGHQIPLENRFGGWHLTGGHHLETTHANLMGQLSKQVMSTRAIQPGELYNASIHLLPTSDVLPQLVHEHQLGFVNKVIALQYVVRSLLHESHGKPGAKEAATLDEMIHDLTRYLLFADEAALPKAGIEGDPAFIKDFSLTKRTSAAGLSLKDFDLKTRLFRHRCSYLIYTPLWEGLPAFVKQRIYARMAEALGDQDREFTYLSSSEKQNIRSILKSTLKDLPVDWK